MTTEPRAASAAQPPSPSRSDKSSDSEGKPVREKLKETRIDAKNSLDRPMDNASTNGAHTGNNSSSDSDRGRLRRKRSHEAFEEGEDAKNPEKKHERHHQRKKSRDVTSPVASDGETTKPVVPPISEQQTDQAVQPTQEKAKASKDEREASPEASNKKSRVASPKNKRSREEAEADADAAPVSDNAAGTSKDALPKSKTEEERTTKRLRDGVDSSGAEATKSKTQIPPESGFANSSTISPFAAIATQKPAPKPTEAAAKDLPQTSSQAFKSSGFGSFASASASPFATTASGSSSPFGGVPAKLSSFASASSTPAAKPSGFASLGASTGSTPSAFGGSTNGSSKSVFGGALGSTAFGGISTGPSKLSSFGSGGGSITGLTQKPVDFGSKETPKATDEDESDNDDADASASESAERKTSSAILQAPGPIETGEENEDAAWVGRAKLYTLAGEKGKKAWQERGMGPFKLNVTREEPIRARFVLRADGTHRLLLNAAVTKTLKFGDGEGKEPKDGKFLFTCPTASGEMESHLLKIRTEKANELWNTVEDLKKSLA